MENKKNSEKTEIGLIEEPLSSKLNRIINADSQVPTIVIEMIELYFAHKKIYDAVKK